MDSLARRKEERELSLYYVYCFSLATEPFSLQEKGMEGENNVFPLSYHDLSALVSCVPLAVYSEKALDENLKDLEWLTPRVKRQEQIIETGYAENLRSVGEEVVVDGPGNSVDGATHHPIRVDDKKSIAGKRDGCRTNIPRKHD